MPLLLIIVAIAGSALRQYWSRLGDEPWQKRFFPWLLQGALFPGLVWALVNLGLSERFPALVPRIAEAHQSNIPWAGLWVAYTLGGLIVIGCHWTALSYVWLLTRIARRTTERKDFVVTCLVFGAFTIPMAAVFIYHYGWFYLGWTIAAALLPMVHFTADLGEERPTILTYSRAIGQLKFGKYKEAEAEVISQLEKSETDFDGWMLLAELYARQYRNVEDAARVVFDVCQDPQARPSQISIACDRLADWQLEIAANPLGARAALDFMIRKIPDTHFARMAEQRLRQIPRSVADFDAARKPKKIRLPPLTENATSAPASRPSTARPDAVAEANRLSAQLTDDPNDIVARHKLALVLAEDLEKTDLGVEQLRLLIELPDPTDEQKAVWSAEIAKWEYHRNRNVEKLQSALRAIIQEYPRTSQAFAAQRQLNLLEWDTKRHPSTAV